MIPINKRRALTGNSSSSRFIDFLTFWQIRVPLWFSVVDWFRVWTGAGIVLCAILMTISVYNLLDCLNLLPDVIALLSMIGAAYLWGST